MNERVTTAAIGAYPEDEDLQDAFMQGVEWAHDDPTALLDDGSEKDCPDCGAPLMWDEWEHPTPGWECVNVNCGKWVPYGQSSWVVEDCKGEFALCVEPGDRTAMLKYRASEDEPWSRVFLTRRQVGQLARVASVIACTLPDVDGEMEA